MKTLHALAFALLILASLSRPAQALTNVAWTGGTGNWSNAALWSPAGVPNGVLYNVLLDNGNVLNSIVDLDMWATIGGLTIDAGDMLRINNGNVFTLSNATVNNAGTILINPDGSTTYLLISGSVNLQGAGKVTLGGTGQNIIRYDTAAGTDILNSSQTIEGMGTIDVLLNNQAGGLVDANISGQTLTLNRATTNAGTLRASNSSTLSLNNLAVANTGGVITATSGGIVNLNYSTINGGTLTNSGGTINSGYGTYLNGAVGGGMTINGTYTLGGGAVTTLGGTMTNNGLINFNAGGSTGYLLIDGAVNLQGTGKVTMGGVGPNQIRYSAASATDTLNSYQTIEGHGTINVLLNNTTGQLVDANISGQTLDISKATTNAGTLQASNGGTLSLLNSITVANTGGVIEAQAGSTVNLNYATITGGTLTNSGGSLNAGYGTQLNGTGAGITLNGTLTLGNGAETRLTGTLNNNGLINFASGGSTTYLVIDGSVNLQGSGKVTMGGVGPNQIYSPSGTGTLNSYQTIEGKGTINVLLNNTTGQLVDANISGQTLDISKATTNAGTLRASNGGTLSLGSIAVANTGGVIEAQVGSTVNLNYATITGGTLTNSGGSLNAGYGTQFNGTGAGITLNGTLTLGNGVQPKLTGTMNNNGVINFDAGGSTTYLLIDGAVTLQGSGKITMGGTGPNQIRYNGSTVTDTLNNAQSIEGKGTIDVKFNNQSSGLVNANISGQTLTVARDLTNTGTLQASGGGTLALSTTTITNIGGMIQALSGSSVNLASGATINGGTVQNIGGTISIGSGVTLDGTHSAGITLAGNLSEPSGGSTTLVNTIHNTGSISLNSAGSSTQLLVGGNGTGSATLLDGGTITLGATGTGSYLSATTSGNRLINEDNTIQGQGIIGSNVMKLTNRGLINANVSGGTLVLNPLSGAGNAVNAGTMRASTGSTLSIQSNIANIEGATNGIIEATAGGILKVQSAAVTGGTVQTVGAGEIQLHSASVTGGSLLNSGTGIIRAATGTSTVNGLNNAAGGQVLIDNGAELKLQNTVQNAGTIQFNASGSTTYLLIDGSVSLQGSGKVTMGGTGPNQILYSANSGTDTLNSAQTIEGKGTINVLLNNQAGGLVDANLTGQMLTLTQATTNAGTLRASGGGTLSLTNIAVANTGGVITATSGSTVNLNASTITGGTLTNSGGTINSGNITHLVGSGAGITLNGTYTLGFGAQTRLTGTMNNNGLINFDASGSTTYLLIDGAVNLQGSGKVTMGGFGPNRIYFNTDAGTDTLHSAQTIEGKGTIDVILNNQSSGLVDANITGQTLTLARNITNTGILQASNGGTLSTSPPVVTNIGGIIQAITTGTVNFNTNTRIAGGTVRNIGSTMTFASGAIFDGTDTAGITLQGAFSIPNGVNLTLLNTVHNQGTIAVNPSGSDTYLQVGGDGTGVVLLDDDGSITLNGSGSTISASTAGNRLVNVDNTISGEGIIGAGNMKLTNGGLILANVPGQTLTVTPQNVLIGGINTGTMRASGGGLLTIQNTIENEGGLVEALAGSRVTVQNGTIDSAPFFGLPGTVQTVGNAEVRLMQGQILNGSLLNSSTGIIRSASGLSRINTLTNPVGGQVIVDSDTTLALQGTLTNNGSIAINTINAIGLTTKLAIEGTVTLLGTGTVTLGTGSGNQIKWGTNAASDVLWNTSQIIQGVGLIDVQMVNQDSGVVQANVNGQTLGMSRNVTNTGILQSSNGGTLSLNSIGVWNENGEIRAELGSTVLLNASTILGGLINNAAGSVRSGTGTYLDGFNYGKVTLQGTYTLGAGASTALAGTIQNQGVINFDAAGSTAYLLIDGAVDLQGLSGYVTMGGTGPNQIRYNGAPATDTLNNFQTIQGKGTIDVLLNNTAGRLVDANISGETLGLSKDTINAAFSTLRASSGGTLSLNSIVLANMGATIQAQTGGIVQMGASTILGGVIDNASGSILSGHGTFLDGSVSGNLTIQGAYTLGLGAITTLKGTINNNGVITYAAAGSTAYLGVDGAVNLQGSGKILMGGSGPNSINYYNSAASDLLNNHQTIEGEGIINVLLNNTAGRLVDANVNGKFLLLNQPTANAGTLRASGGGNLGISSVAVGNTGGLILATGSGSSVLLSGSTIVGGTLTNTGNGASIYANGNSHLDGVGAGLTINGVVTLLNGSATKLTGTIVNNGQVNYASSGSSTYLGIDGTVYLQGNGGRITMGGSGDNHILRQSSPTTDTLVNNLVIEGRGIINVLFDNKPDNSGTAWVDRGVVDANISGATLTLSGGVTNNGGILQASNGGTLSVTPTSIPNIGGNIQVLADSTINLASNTLILGGTVGVFGSNSQLTYGTSLGLNGTDSAGITIYQVAVHNGTGISLEGTIHNVGNLAMNAANSFTNLYILGTVDLDGVGTVTMGSGAGNQIRYGFNPSTDELNNFQTIQGRGTIDVIMENKSSGVINGNVAGQTLDINRDVINRGVLRAENGGTLSINGIGLSTSQIDSRAGSQVIFNSPSFLLDQGTTITGPAQTRVSGGTTFIGDSPSDTIPTTNFLVAGGTLTGQGTMNVFDSFTLTAGTVTGSGDLNFFTGSDNTFNGASSTIDARPVNNHEFATLNVSSDSLTLRGGTVIANEGTINVQNSATVNGNANGGSTIDNYNLLKKTGSGTATLSTTLNNTGTVEVQSGTLVLSGVSTSSGTYVVNNDLDFSFLDFGTGIHHLNAGTDISGTGQARVNSGGTLSVNATVHANDIALTAGVIEGFGNLIIDSHMYWSGGTQGDFGQTFISSGASMEIAIAGTKYLEGRALVNTGTVNWSGGTIYASSGADFSNSGNLGVTGNVTFTAADQSSIFINNASGNIAVPTGSLLTINADFTNNGDVQQGGSFSALTNSSSVAAAGGGTVAINGKFTNNGTWEAIGSFLNWITGGIFAPKTMTGTTKASGGGQISIHGQATVTIANGSLEALAGGSIVAAGGGNIVAAGGGNIVAAGGGNIVAAGGGNIVAAGGGNIVAAGGGNITHNGTGNIVAAGGGNIVAAGGGNIVAAGGGNIVAAGGGNIVAAGGGNVLSHNGNAIVAGNDALVTNADGLSSASFTGPIILAESGGNLIGHSGGTFTGNVVAELGGSLLPGDAGGIGTMTVIGGLDLQTGSLLKMDINALGQGTGYDFLTISETATFNGNLILNLGYAIRTLAGTDTLTLLTAASPVSGTIGNLTGNRVADADGLGSFRVTYGTTNSVVLDDFQATALTFAVWQSAWSIASGESGDFDADPDHDGADNGLEYGLGMDPMTSDADLLPVVSIIDVSGMNYLALTYVRQAGVNTPTDLTFAVERSTNPSSGWSAAGVLQQSATPGPGTGFETVIMRSTTPVGAPGNEIEFLRLKVTGP